jgi:hypothetical protein
MRTIAYGESQIFFIQEEPLMSTECNNEGCACTPNTSVKCTVNNCAYHCQDENYCGLNAVQIGTHESNPTEKQCVDCDSFKLK